MTSPKISLPAVDEARITLVMDNSLDLLIPSSEVAQRFIFSPKWLKKFQTKPGIFDGPLPYAEHGYSALISVKGKDKPVNVCAFTFDEISKWISSPPTIHGK
jgi:hypothetical protein